ncbi:hypothetical protein B0H13DRAFT_2372253 [Mycena leptocephala]|nr:hypothetical protein B0H13DRAFT_2372253 [Mycena leptocephala]
MTNLGYSAPAAVSPPTVAGAGVSPAVPQQVNAALAAFNAAVDTLTTNATALISTSMADMNDALDGVASAADAVQHAQSAIAAALSAAFQVPAPTPQAQSAPQAAPQAASQFIRTSGPWIAGVLYSVIPGAALTAVPDNGGKWFAITRGKYIGLTQNSAISWSAVTGISTGLSEKFNNQTDALNHFNAAHGTNSLAVI